jgi:hypothetical protein
MHGADREEVNEDLGRCGRGRVDAGAGGVGDA